MKDETGYVTRKCARFPLRSEFRRGSPYFELKLIMLRFSKKRSVFTLFSFNKVASSLFSLFSRQKFVFQSEHFGSKIKLKISPLPRAWKRTNILNADKVTQSKFQTPKRGGSPIWGEDLSVDPGAVPRAKWPWVSLRSVFLFRTGPRDWYKNSLCSSRLESPRSRTPARSRFRLYQKLIIGKPKNSIPQNRERLQYLIDPTAKSNDFGKQVLERRLISTE